MSVRCFVALGANLGDPVATVKAALAALRDITGTALGLRFPKMQARCEDLRPQLDRLNHLQITLLRQSRTGAAGTTVPLMQSMTCIASGLGWTG